MLIDKDGLYVTQTLKPKYKGCYGNNFKKKGLYLALNTFLVRIVPMLKVNPSQTNNDALNELFKVIVTESDLLLWMPMIDMENKWCRLQKHLAESLRAPNPWFSFTRKVTINPQTDQIKIDV